MKVLSAGVAKEYIYSYGNAFFAENLCLGFIWDPDHETASICTAKLFLYDRNRLEAETITLCMYKRMFIILLQCHVAEKENGSEINISSAYYRYS